MVDPQTGLERALRLSRQKTKVGDPTVLLLVLSSLAGACVMLLWLKAGDVFGFGRVTAEEFLWSVFVAALVAGAIAGAIALGLTGVVVRPLLSRNAQVTRADVRTIWGVSSLPLAVGFLFLLVGDLALVGSTAYTRGDPTTLQTIWGATSIAIGVALDVWATYLLVKGISIAGKISARRAIPIAVVALVTMMLGFALLLGVAIGIRFLQQLAAN